MPIQFFFLNNNISLTNRKALKIFIAKIINNKKRKLSNLNYIFCSDKYLLQINKKHLKHNFYTDIITFNLSDDPNLIFAEIYISIERVRENAKLHNNSIKEEIHRVIFHGVLHLFGLSDKSEKEQKDMRNAENALLKKYFK